MATKIVTKNSSTASAVPTASDLVQGELAVNVADKRLFTEDNAGAIVELGTNPYNFTANHNGSAKLSTTSTGIDVTGNLTMASGGSIVAGGVNDLILNAGESGTPDIYLQSGGSTKVKIEGSDGSVGIGTGSPSAPLDVRRGDADGKIAEFHQSGGYGLELSSSQSVATITAGYNQAFTFETGTTATERMRIDSSGKLTYGGLSYGVAVDPDGFGGFGSGYNFETNGGSPRHLVTGPVAGQYLSAGSSPFVAWYTGTSVGAGTAAAERMRIDSSGNVGIGCTPSTKLDVAGSGKFQPAIGGGDALVTIAQTNSNAYVHAGIKINAGAANPFYIYQSGSSNTLRFNYNSMSDAGGQMVIDSSGRLGLGVTPEAWSSIFKVLRVGTGSSIAGESGGTSTWFNTNAYYDGSWKRINTNTSAQIAHTSDGKQEFKVAASGSAGSAISWNTAMTVDNSGNLLVGVTSPQDFDSTTTNGHTFYGGSTDVALHSRNNANPLALQRTGNDGSICNFYKDTTTVGTIGSNAAGGTPVLDISANSSSGIMRMLTSGAERIRIDSSGRVLVNTTDDIGGARFNVEHTTDCIGCNLGPSASGTRYFMYFTYNGTNVGSIRGGPTSTAFTTSSDQRLKENIADADDAGSKVDAIQVRQFDWKADGSHQDYGMIAQELQAVAPEAVFGDADSEKMMGVDYSKLVPMLIKEIQSLRNRVAQLEE